MAYDLQLDRPVASNIAKVDVSSCPACTSPDRRVLFRVTEHEYANTTDDEFTLKECRGCGAWYLDPRPAVSALEVIYPPNYYAYVMEAKLEEGSDDTSFRGPMKKLALAIFRQRVSPIVKHLEIGPGTTWLDIGCGAGLSLESMQRAYGIRGVGLDMSEGSVASCRERGFEAHAGRFEDYQARPGEAYDFVLSSHVIEHVESPIGYMQKAWDLLKPGGLNVFITPNVASPEAGFFGANWGPLHVPRHWTMLSGESARSLGERTGFEHVETRYSTNATFWIWSFHASLRGKLAPALNDWLFPSDHRSVESTVMNLARGAFFTFFDITTLLFSKRSANMLCIFRKPLADSAARKD